MFRNPSSTDPRTVSDRELGVAALLLLVAVVLTVALLPSAL